MCSKMLRQRGGNNKQGFRSRAISERELIQIDFGKKLTLGVSICLDRVSIETLDLDTGRELVSTVEKISTLSKS